MKIYNRSLPPKQLDDADICAAQTIATIAITKMGTG